jgi:hypothetical protein
MFAINDVMNAPSSAKDIMVGVRKDFATIQDAIDVDRKPSPMVVSEGRR